jgi:hypothetical protein
MEEPNGIIIVFNTIIRMTLIDDILDEGSLPIHAMRSIICHLIHATT